MNNVTGLTMIWFNQSFAFPVINEEFRPHAVVYEHDYVTASFQPTITTSFFAFWNLSSGVATPVIWQKSSFGVVPVPPCQSLTATYQLGCLTWGGDIFRFDDSTTVDFFEGRIAEPTIDWLVPNVYWSDAGEVVDPLTCNRVIDDEGANLVKTDQGNVMFITQPTFSSFSFNYTIHASPPIACGRDGEHVADINVDTMAAKATIALATADYTQHQWQPTRTFAVSSKIVSRIALLCEHLLVFSDTEGSSAQYLVGPSTGALLTTGLMITDVSCHHESF
jgi:hypothetical protein